MARGFHMFLPHLLNCSQLYTLSISQLYSQLFHLPPLISVLVDCCFDLEKCGGQRSKQRGKYKPRRMVCMVVFLGWTCRSPETFRHNGWQVQDPGAEREAAAAAKIAVGQWISKAVDSPSLEFCQWWLWRSALNATSWCSIGLQETSRTCIRVIWFKDRARVNLLLKMGCSDWSVLAGYRDRFQRRHWNGNKSGRHHSAKAPVTWNSLEEALQM